jgi:hypothetical protein
MQDAREWRKQNKIQDELPEGANFMRLNEI